MESTLTRRGFLTAAGSALAGLATTSIERVPGALVLPSGPRPAIVRMRSEAAGSRVAFDPVGLHVSPGTTVRWVLESGAHSATAYHSANDRPRRVPAGAAPWDSGILFEPGATFEIALDLAGVYDVFCLPHEAAGMVGRIVVGVPGVDFEIPAWARPGPESRASRLPPRARGAFPPVEQIVEHTRVPDVEPVPSPSKGDPS